MRRYWLLVIKVLAAVVHPMCRRALFYGVAASLEHERAFRRSNFDRILDVGANRGQFTLFAKLRFPQSKIISFEPLDAPAQIFDQLFRRDRGVCLVRAAIGNSPGRLKMYVTAKDDSSSALEVDKNQSEIFGTKVSETCEVRCGRLEEFVTPDMLTGRTLLKIDTQGFELEVLRGSANLLPDILAVYCEVSFVPLYKGQPLASEIIHFLKESGFDLRGVYNTVSDKNLGPVQADMLFMKAGPGGASVEDVKPYN